MEKNFDYQLNGLRAGVVIYAPVFMYLFLKMREKFQTNYDGVDDAIEKIAGRPCSQWPESIKDDFDKLFTVKDELVNLYREFFYFLIFIFSGYANKYFKDKDDQVAVLNHLFEIFQSTAAPWFQRPPDHDAYDKYSKSDNVPVVLLSEISKITNEQDPLFWSDFISRVSNMSEYLIEPATAKLFDSK